MVVLKKSYFLLIIRGLKRSFSRFLAIFAIVMLGAGFLSGLLATTPDMKETTDTYYDQTKMMDIRLVSTGGLTDDDVKAVASISGVSSVMPSHTVDELVSFRNTKDVVARLHSLPDPNDSSQSYLNQLMLTEGRMPLSPNECVILNEKNFENPVSLNQKVVLSPENNDLDKTFNNTEFTVVGFADSAYYMSVMSVQRDPTNLGSGRITCVIFVPDSACKLDFYSDIFITSDEALVKNSFDEEYFDILEPVKDKMNDIAPERCQARYDGLMLRANSEIDKTQNEYDQQKASALAELEKAKNKLDAAAAQIDEAETKLSSGSAEIESGKREVSENEQKISEGMLLADEALIALNHSREQYAVAVAEFNAKKQTVYSELDSKQAEIDAGSKELDNAQGQIDEGYEELDLLAQTIANTKQEIKELYEQGKIDEAHKLEEILKIIQDLYDKGVTEIRKAQEDVDRGRAKIAESQALIDSSRATAQAEFSLYQGILDESNNRIVAGQAELDSQLEVLSSSRETLQQAEKLIEQKEIELNAGISELAKAKADLADGINEYNEKGTDTYAKLNDAQSQIDSARAELPSKIAKPVWRVLDRESNLSYATFVNNVEKVQSISSVFPIFFFLVATLVALTTLSRMVEEDRIQIGTLKALGYSKPLISMNYIIYSGLASILGCVLGFSVGFKLFPTIIWNTYSSTFDLPPINARYIPSYAAVISLCAVLCTVLTAIISCYSSLKEVPADLMHAKAPKAGKRILLEKIPFIWSRLGFIRKITIRNLFRYKKRFFMTVIGIAGCTALILTGFGLSDSLSGVLIEQYGDIEKYDITLRAKQDDFSSDNSQLWQILENKDMFTDYMLMYSNDSIIADESGKESEDHKITLNVPENPERLHEFITFKNVYSQDDLRLTDDGVIITQKISEILRLHPGDTFEFSLNNGETATVKIAGIMKNYVLNSVYMTPSLFEKSFGHNTACNLVIASSLADSEDERDDLAEQLLNTDSLSGVSFNKDIFDVYTKVISSLNYIVAVLVVTAALLAFVVLYNLLNINITERKKEIGTIKVLGFYDKEVYSYIFRETFILTLIGAAIGLVLGVILHRFIVLSIEMEEFMFNRVIFFPSYIWATVLTLVFSFAVSFIMRRKLRNISMVESMKSNE